ncbi:hypothetical protein BGZ83_008082 [Gryganskiella cystojenkinii]|nr:hypothetical protein BGZ83_008082 [Gryganskiella cystojenkinii]
MPSATFNRDRAGAQQHFQNPLLRHGADDQCIPSPQQQYDLQDALFGSSSSALQANTTVLSSSGSSSSATMDDFMMSMALNEDMDLSKFSNASQGGLSDFTHMSSANCDANGTPIPNGMDNRSNNRPTNIEQSQLLSGSRT